MELNSVLEDKNWEVRGHVEHSNKAENLLLCQCGLINWHGGAGFDGLTHLTDILKLGALWRRFICLNCIFCFIVVFVWVCTRGAARNLPFFLLLDTSTLIPKFCKFRLLLFTPSANRLLNLLLYIACYCVMFYFLKHSLFSFSFRFPSTILLSMIIGLAWLGWSIGFLQKGCQLTNQSPCMIWIFLIFLSHKAACIVAIKLREKFNIGKSGHEIHSSLFASFLIILSMMGIIDKIWIVPMANQGSRVSLYRAQL